MEVATPGKHAMHTVNVMKTPAAGTLIFASILSFTFTVKLLNHEEQSDGLEGNSFVRCLLVLVYLL